jgi:hypothetical protein
VAEEDANGVEVVTVVVVKGTESGDVGVTVELLLKVTEDVNVMDVDIRLEVADEEVKNEKSVDVELEVAIEVVVDADVPVLRSLLSR